MFNVLQLPIKLCPVQADVEGQLVGGAFLIFRSPSPFPCALVLTFIGRIVSIWYGVRPAG